MLVEYYEVNSESALSKLPFKAGSIYVCRDSKLTYFDSIIDGKRIMLSNSTITLETEDDRLAIENPIENKMYMVKTSKLFYIYVGGEWYTISRDNDDIGKKVFIGEAAPETDIHQLWVDISLAIPMLKYKTEDGVWVPIAGGGSGGGGSLNNAILKVVNKAGWLSKTIAYGASCTMDIEWSSLEDELPTGNGIITIYVNGTRRDSYEIRQGPVPVDVTKYLDAGNNTIQINVADIYDNKRTINYSVNVISVSISSYFDSTLAYTGAINFTYTPVGAIEKTVHFIIDGEEIGTQVVSVSNREQAYTIPAQTHGSHILEVYFTGEVEGQPVESNRLWYDIICYVAGNKDPIITTEFTSSSIKQYATIGIPYYVYTPDLVTSHITLKEGETIVNNLTVDRTKQIWSYRALDFGKIELSIICGNIVKKISFEVLESNIDVSAETSNLELYLSSSGRSNNEEKPLVWGNNGVYAEFSNFNLNSDGWKLDEDNNTVLRVAGDARVHIPFTIFNKEKDFKVTGKTIEIEFATRSVLNYDTTVISSWSGDRGILITAQKATFKSQQSEIFTQYKEEETVRITFSIERSAEHRLLSIYINGVMSGVIQYPDDDDFSQVNPVGISIGSNECTTDIYSIRVYNTSLTRYQILDNWIADTQNIETLIERYDRNNIFDDYGNITISKLPNYLPYMIVYANSYQDLPQSKGDKKTVSGKYVDLLHPERSFTWEGGQIDVQGTSSQYYSRKNYKLKFKKGLVVNGVQKDAYAMRPNSIPTAEFCFKADVASSEGCNNVELVRLYDEICPVKTYPQTKDSRIRQGIEGYPMVMFYGPDDSNLHFLGKYNFNNDKGTPEVYGLEDDDESWEVKLNTTDMVVWKNDDFESTYWDDKDKEYKQVWTQSFEARHPEDNTDVTNLRAFSSWLKSTDTTAEGLTEDEKKARIQKFKNEFANYANVDAMIFNYIFTETFLMVDNRAKNAFPTRYGEDGKWLILPYDYDTALGIDNEGGLKFGYELEDTDIVNDANVYNGQDSVLYVNMRLAFYDRIKSMYSELRSKTNTVFAWNVIADRFTEHQKTWGEAIFNEDGRFKYIDPLVNDGETMYLPMAQGSKEEQRKWWLYNRFRYLDSKYNTGDAAKDYILLRTYGVADITVIPYADIYATVSYDGNLVQARALRGSSYTLKNPLTTANHSVVSIYSASQLTDIGDLSGLKVSMANFAMATKLSSLKVGDASEGYTNPNLTDLTIGNLTLLRNLDVRNCINLKQSVDLSGCINIEYVYFDGTKITGIKLPNGGNLKTLHLPNTVSALTIQNQMSLVDFYMPSYENISTLRLEGVPQQIFDTIEIIEQIQPMSRIRLIGVEWNVATAEEIFALMDKIDTFRGIDENGFNIDKPVISGTIHTGSVNTEDLALMNERYPNLIIDYIEISAIVTFFNEGERVHTQIVYDYMDCPDPVEVGYIDIPIKTETDYSKFVYIGWDKSLKEIKRYTDVNAVYEEYQKYFVTFYDGRGGIANVNGNDTNTYYLRDGENVIAVPTIQEYVETIDGVNYIYRFSHWVNRDTGVDGITEIGGDVYTYNYEAQYTEHRVYTIKFMNEGNTFSTIYKCQGETFELPGIPTKDATYFESFNFVGWSLDGSTIITPDTTVGTRDITYIAVYEAEDIFHTVTFYTEDKLISSQTLQYGNSIMVPNDPNKDSTNTNNYTFIGWSLDGETIVEPDVVGETDLVYIAVYEESIRYYTVRYFNGTKLIETVQVTYDTDAPYTGGTPTNIDEERFVGWEPINTGIKEDTDCYAQFAIIISHRLLRRTITELISENVTTIGNNACAGAENLVTVDLPNAITIGDNAFATNKSLINLNIPKVTEIMQYAFSGCISLPKVVLPSTTGIDTYAFSNNSALSFIDMHVITGINLYAFRNCNVLNTVIIRNSELCNLVSTNAFEGTPIANGTGCIYVPAALVEVYKSATNWSAYADQIHAIEDYPEICG